MTTVTATATPVPPPPQGGETYRLALPNSASAAKVARDFVTSLLGVNRHSDLVDDARLCVTEVVTNAHRHTHTPDSVVPPGPLDVEEGYTYTCYCCPDPVRVTIRSPQSLSGDL